MMDEVIVDRFLQLVFTEELQELMAEVRVNLKQG